MATGSSDNFVVIWESEGSAGSDSDSESIQGQRFDSSGAGPIQETNLVGEVVAVASRPPSPVSSLRLDGGLEATATLEVSA